MRKSIVVLLAILFPLALSASSEIAPRTENYAGEIEKAAAKVYGRKQVDFGKALKRVADARTEPVFRVLEIKGPISFGELRIFTEIDQKQLNVILEQMKKDELLVLRKGKYHVTGLGVLTRGAWRFIQQKLNALNEIDLYEPFAMPAPVDVKQ